MTWDDYRRAINKLGWKNVQPGVWARRNEDGSLHVFLPWTFRDGREEWQWLAEQGLAPDGTKMEAAFGE